MSCPSKINHAVEGVFEKLGYFISKKRAFVVPGVLLVGGGLAAGLAMAVEPEGLGWVEASSRIHSETDFKDKYFADDETRSEILTMATNPKGGDVLNEAGLAELERLTKAAMAVTYTARTPEARVYTWDDVCSRPLHPAILDPIFLKAGEVNGFPCVRITALDCFKEGEWDSVDHVAAIDNEAYLDAETLTIPPKFANLPSYKGLSDAEIRDAVKNSCNYGPGAGRKFPIGFLFGGLEYDADGDITMGKSFQNTFILESPYNLAKKWRQKDCQQQCRQDKCLTDNDQCFNPDYTFPKEDDPSTLFIEDYRKDVAGWNWNAYYDDLGLPCEPSPACSDGPLPIGLFAPRYVYQNVSAYAKIAFCITSSVMSLEHGPGLLNAEACGDYLKRLARGREYDEDDAFGTWACVQETIDYFDDTCRKELDDAFTTCLNTGADCATACDDQCEVDFPVTDYDLREAEDVLRGWEMAYQAAIENVEVGASAYYLGPFTARSSDDLVKAAGSADFGLMILGYLAMIICAASVLIRPNWLESRGLVGVMGVFVVIVSVVASLGVIAMVGIPFGPSLIQVLPFLALGLGVDDMFVMAFTMKFNLDDSAEFMTAEMLKEAGASISLTSLTNFIAFVIGSTIPLPAVSQFSLAAAIVVLVNYFIVLFAFTGVLAWDTQRRLDEKKDCFFCCVAPEDSLESSKDYGEEETCFDGVAYQCMRLPVRIFSLVLSLGFIGLAVYGATLLETGLPLEDIVPSDHYTHKFLGMHEDFYEEQPADLGIGMNLQGQEQMYAYDGEGGLEFLVAMEKRVNASGLQINTDQGITVHDGSWIDGLIRFINNEELCAVRRKNPCRDMLNTDSVYDVPWTSPKKSYDYMIDDEHYFINPTDFYEALDLYLNDFEGQNYLTSIKFNATTGNATHPRKIAASKIMFYVKGLVKTQDYLDFIKQSREAIDLPVTLNGDTRNLPVFAMGFMYDFYEQYMNVNEYMVKNLAFVAIGVICTSFTFLFHPMAVLIMCIVIAAIIVEVYGFMVWFGIKANGVTVVNLVMAVGVSVEFTAHIVRAFVICPGDSRAERAEQALSSLMPPTALGAFSTFLGCAFTAFSRFPYFRIYFFNLYTLIILFGAFNGLLFLPTLLSFFGPPPILMDLPEVDEKPEGQAASQKIAPAVPSDDKAAAEDKADAGVTDAKEGDKLVAEGPDETSEKV